MDVSSHSVRVTIFGDEYVIKGDVEVETTKRVAEYVNGKMAELREHNAAYDKLKIAILSALNIAGELFDYKAKNDTHEKQLGELERKAEVLARKIDVAL